MSQSKNATRLSIPAVFAATCLLLGATELSAGDSPWYVETKLGPASLDAQFGSRWPKFFDDDHGAATVEVGYSVNRYFAVQAGYHDFGNYQGSGSPCLEESEGCIATIDPLPFALCVEGVPFCGPLVAVPLAVEVTGLSLSAVPQWPLGERFSVYGKLGVIDWESEVSGLLDVRRTERFSNTDVLAGVGAKYTFAKGLGVLAEYQRLDLDLGSASLGASWRF